MFEVKVAHDYLRLVRVEKFTYSYISHETKFYFKAILAGNF